MSDWKDEETIRARLVEQHWLHCERLNTIYNDKNRRYGDSFNKSLDKYGHVAAMVRLEDKWNRLHQLLKITDDYGDESVYDTIDDMTNYLIMLRMWLENNESEQDA
jgi:hypothetical protein